MDGTSPAVKMVGRPGRWYHSRCRWARCQPDEPLRLWQR